jgi:ABC-2 type transport system permease protein
MASKEVLHIRRDPSTLYLALGMPVLMLLIFGYGVSFDLERMPVAVVDQDQSDASRLLARDFMASREFVSAGELDLPRAEHAVRAGRALAILAIPAEFGRRLAAGEPSPVQLMVDGSDVLQANQVLTKADAIVRVHGAMLAGATLAPALARPLLQAKTWIRFNPTGSSAIFMVPGLAVYLLAISAVLLTALTVSGEWERGSMEQLFASPVGRLEIVLGKLLPFLVLGMLELLLVIATGAVVFAVPIRGNLLILFTLGLFFLVAMLGQGLLISVLARNQLVATQAGALSALLPSLLLSGMIVPIENMPRALQLLSAAIPARYLVHGVRGVLLKGSGLADLWPDLVAQLVFGLVVLTLATARFRRRVA